MSVRSWISRTVLCALLSTLAACATPSAHTDDTPAPPAVDPRLCASVSPEPIMPAAATIVQPVTDVEKTATQAFLNWQASVLDWGRSGWSRVELAMKTDCH